MLLDQAGQVKWAKAIGGSQDDPSNNIWTSPTQSAIIWGNTRSYGFGGADGCIYEIDTSGNISWSRTYGGKNDDFLMKGLIYEPGNTTLGTAGRYVFCGITSSFGNGQRDMWVISTDTLGNTDCNTLAYTPQTSNVNPAISNAAVQVFNGYQVRGETFNANALSLEETTICSGSAIKQNDRIQIEYLSNHSLRIETKCGEKVRLQITNLKGQILLNRMIQSSEIFELESRNTMEVLIITVGCENERWSTKLVH